MEPVDERKWVEMAQAGDADGIACLYECYVDRIYRYVFLRIGDPAEAEDVTGQVFLKMIETIGDFQWRGTPFSSWLYRIAHNLTIDAFRRRSRRPTVPIEPLDDSLVSEKHDPHEDAERGILLEDIREAMAYLTDLQAQVIALKYAAELSNVEVAEVMSRSVTAVNSIQHKALRNLQRILTMRGYSP